MVRAYYNPVTDKIEGCTKGSYRYAHEERHRWQYKKGIADKADKMHVFLYYASFFSAIIGYLLLDLVGMFLMIGITFTPHMIANFLLEIDAYTIGYINWRKEITQDRKEVY